MIQVPLVIVLVGAITSMAARNPTSWRLVVRCPMLVVEMWMAAVRMETTLFSVLRPGPHPQQQARQPFQSMEPLARAVPSNPTLTVLSSVKVPIGMVAVRHTSLSSARVLPTPAVWTKMGVVRMAMTL